MTAAAGKISATPSDAGADADADAASDAGKDAGADAAKRSAKLAEIDIHPSFAAKCADAATCDFTNVAASDAPDVAVLVLDADLDPVPTIPVDLDPVSPADPLLVVLHTGRRPDDGSDPLGRARHVGSVGRERRPR